MDLFSQSLQNLSTWFKSHSRQLPWRDQPEAYRVWISEIMLQQTQVVTVIDYFNRFIEVFPTLESLSKASENEVVALWSGLGYYSRARNLLKAGKQMESGGGVPDNRKDLEALSGIGPYTAGAILSIAFGQYEPILDGNLDRVFSRLLEIPRDKKYKKKLWRISTLVMKKAKQLKLDPSVINQALMEIGALICRKQNPLCDQCPFTCKCKSFQHETQSLYPQKAPRKKFIQLQETVLFLINSEGNFLVELNPNGQWRKGTWDLPVLEEATSTLFEQRLSSSELIKKKVNLVVTHHKISRDIIAPINLEKSGVTLSDLIHSKSSFQWVSDYSKIPYSSALKKSVDLMRQ